MKEVRIVFMGTPEFAVASLRRLQEAGVVVAGVVTSPDRPAGRGQKLQQSAVKEYALANGLPVLQPEKLKDPGFLEELSQLKANLQVVVAFRMLPREVWQLPALGTFNLHASLLPDYRGAAPINWAIINGETETGVTTFFIDEKIDTGAILLQEKTALGPDETAGELHDRLMVMGAGLVLRTVELIASGKARPQPQPDRGAVHAAPKLDKETCRIDWNKPLNVVYNHIRGLSPYPAAWTMLVNGTEEILVKIYRARPISDTHSLMPGTLISDGAKMQVAVPGGFLDVLQIQLAGKRRLEVKEVLNGLKLKKNACLV